MRRFLRAYQERRRANQADAPPGNVRQIGAPIWRTFGPLIPSFSYLSSLSSPPCHSRVLGGGAGLSDIAARARGGQVLQQVRQVARPEQEPVRASGPRAAGQLIELGSPTILLIDNRSRAEANKRTATSKPWQGFASAVELLAGDAR